ncbi:MAG: ABC transporter ATP-binding protein [Gammaproteobacteria bacterium]
MTGEALIEVADLVVELGRRRVLDVAKLRIERGRVVLLCGDNGSGKTTLLKVLAGLLIAGRGAFRCLGSRMSPRGAARFCRGRHVYLHQTPYLFDGTVAENVSYGLELRGHDRAQREIEIREALAWAGLDHLADRPSAQLSTGEKQRVALVRARVLAPPLLLLDEITANMDTASRQRVQTMLGDFQRAGSSVVLATHDPDSLTMLATARIELAAGRMAERSAAPERATIIPFQRHVTDSSRDG